MREITDTNRMNVAELEARLRSAAEDKDDFPYAVDDIVEELPVDPGNLDLVACVLGFMEMHGNLDYGAPGSLVHYLERFYRRGYEELLLSSVARRPVSPTVAMLKRAINAASDETEKARLVAALRLVKEHPQADSDVKRLASLFLGGSSEIRSCGDDEEPVFC
jgi:hypothetical protein